MWSNVHIVFSKCSVSWFQLVCFGFSTFTKNVYIKDIYSRNSRCSAKEVVISLLLWSNLYIAFSKCKVFWFYFAYLNFLFLTGTPYVEVISSWNFSCSAKEAVIFLLSWRALYVVIWNCVVSWFQLLSMNWLQLVQRASAKVSFSWNFRCSAKEAVLVLGSWGTLDIVFWDCKVTWF